ncbi:hypothetical protein [Microbacterium sp. T32]|uniref:hypothetical protein n=1 Tax=Microbacterium sp. T32 TaxID=1776083 RepID=UPI0007AC24B5|nr:hypothetical protein [Microbacterium sp. T32]KZE41403.1 hypothetical protein AVW09_02105 [Microbacterium sp. T32]
MKASGAIVGGVVIVAAFAALNVAAAVALPTAVKVEPDPHAEAGPTPLPPVILPPVATPATLDAYGILAQRSEPLVQVVYSADPAVNCGLNVAPVGGCFHPEQPETIVLSPGVEGAQLTYLVLHELAHVRQNRYGVPLDECAADAAAVAWGADEALTFYLPNC